MAEEKKAESRKEVRKKDRPEDERRALTNRLSRIEGQIRGIKKMVEENAYCNDILIQVTAVTAALNSFSKELLSSHIRECVVKDIKDGKEESVDELISMLQMIMRQAGWD